MTNGCEECARLWSAYSIATHRHFQLDSKLQLAGLSHDHELVQELTPAVDESSRQRIALREEIAAHERDFHADGTTSVAAV